MYACVCASARVNVRDLVCERVRVSVCAYVWCGDVVVFEFKGFMGVGWHSHALRDIDSFVLMNCVETLTHIFRAWRHHRRRMCCCSLSVSSLTSLFFLISHLPPYSLPLPLFHVHYVSRFSPFSLSLSLSRSFSLSLKMETSRCSYLRVSGGVHTRVARY